jgi:hypothetical protein
VFVLDRLVAEPLDRPGVLGASVILGKGRRQQHCRRRQN